MSFLPVQLGLSGRLCLLVGGGAVARRKSHKFASYGARVRVVAPKIVPSGWPPSVELCAREFSEADAADAFLVVAATADRAYNARIVEIARRHRALAQNADDPEGSDFTLPATLQRGDLSVSFSTNGSSPAFASYLRDGAAVVYGEAHAEFCALARGLRVRALRELPMASRAPLFRRLLGAGILEAFTRGERDHAYAIANDLFQEASNEAAASGVGFVPSAPESTPLGRVFLVGAGPGDPGLITVKGVACLRLADTVFYDALVSPDLLDLYCPRARHVSVRKRKGHCEYNQDEIQELLIQHARQGETVVRLKGGDPIVFGRGSEETRALRQAGIPFEVVSGVSSITAVPTYAGIAITDRDLASSVGVYSAHRRGGLAVDDDEWRRIAAGPDTLVILMGKSRLAIVTEKLVAHGRPSSTPAAMIFNGTLPDQCTIVGTLGDLAARTLAARTHEGECGGPALIVVGKAVHTRSFMDWFDPAALPEAEHYPS